MRLGGYDPLRKFGHGLPESMTEPGHAGVAALLLAGVIACATPAQAAETWTKTWTCTYSTAVDNRPTVTRFELSPSELIESNFHQTYRIEKKQ